LDGGPPRPDPRSAFQPGGIHGPSRVVDHSAFAWRDSGWRGVPLPGSVLYECHVGTFSAEGTFDGAIDHLRHLVDLGVDIIELRSAGGGCRCQDRSSTSATSEPSPQRARSTGPSIISGTWWTWVSTSSNCCPWRNFPVVGGGVTTEWTCSPRTMHTGGRMVSSGSSTPPTTTDSA